MIKKKKKKRAIGGAVFGDAVAPRLDRKARGGSHWIAGAIKHPGALHRALHVPKGEKIPAKKMAQAAKSDSPRIKRMVALAHTLKGLHH